MEITKRPYPASGGRARDGYFQDVTGIARRIFGDIVVCAQVALTDDAEAVEREAGNQKHEDELIDVSSNLGFVVIEFINGKKVQFNTYEWGNIEPFVVPEAR